MPAYLTSLFVPLKRLLDRSHRWLGLLACGQILLWSLSGFLMYTLDFSDLYSDPPPRPLALQGTGLSPAALQQRLMALVPGSSLTGIQATNLGGELAYLLSQSKGAPVLLDAGGRRIDPIGARLATRIATAGYTGKGRVSAAELLPQSAGNYMSSAPVWRIRFDDAQQTEIYVDPATGSLLARRKALWAVYNRMWELHLMKYTPSAPLNKALLLIFAVLNALVALTGLLKFLRPRRQPIGGLA